MEKSLAIFQGQKIRKTWHNEEWWFSIVDIVEFLTESANPNRYWSDLKINLKKEGFELYDIIVQLKIKSSDGKKYLTDCANTQGTFRIIQSRNVAGNARKETEKKIGKSISSNKKLT